MPKLPNGSRTLLDAFVHSLTSNGSGGSRALAFVACVEGEAMNPWSMPEICSHFGSGLAWSCYGLRFWVANRLDRQVASDNTQFQASSSPAASVPQKSLKRILSIIQSA